LNTERLQNSVQFASAADLAATNLARVHERVHRASRAAGRNASDVTIVAVTKTFAPSAVELALRAGLRVFGENRVQEAQTKIPAVRDAGYDAEWHFIGHLQTNKVRAALSLFQVIQSVDNLKLAQTIDRVAGEENVIVPVLIEVNTSGEESKHGFAPAQLLEAAAMVIECPHLEARGLMTVGPLSRDREEVRAAFRSLRRARDQLAVHVRPAKWDTLSMGMSDDFETAIEEGSTMIRLGRAIFGRRE
jgi:pyridoxal phosphate enzyme (YggS family)